MINVKYFVLTFIAFVAGIFILYREVYGSATVGWLGVLFIEMAIFAVVFFAGRVYKKTNPWVEPVDSAQKSVQERQFGNE